MGCCFFVGFCGTEVEVLREGGRRKDDEERGRGRKHVAAKKTT
jgi:hypothetical protein